MFHRRYRLKRSGLLTRCLKSGRRLSRSALFDIVALPKVKDPSHPRFAIVVSKKVSNRATKRNRLRRQVRDVIRTHWLAATESHPLFGYSAVIVFVKESALGQPYAALKSAMDLAWPTSK